MTLGITRKLAQAVEARPPAPRALARANRTGHHAVLAVLTIVLAMFLGSTADAASATTAPAELRAAGTAAAAPCGYNGAHPTLRQGDRGDAVRHAQCLLRKIWGYPIAMDGIFGPNTASAVRGHQRDCNIAVDGVVGPQTWRALHPDTAPRACGS